MRKTKYMQKKKKINKTIDKQFNKEQKQWIMRLNENALDSSSKEAIYTFGCVQLHWRMKRNTNKKICETHFRHFFKKPNYNT